MVKRKIADMSRAAKDLATAAESAEKEFAVYCRKDRPAMVRLSADDFLKSFELYGVHPDMYPAIFLTASFEGVVFEAIITLDEVLNLPAGQKRHYQFIKKAIDAVADTQENAVNG